MSDELPPRWAIRPLTALGTWLGGGTPSKAEPRFWKNGTIHWVSPKDMKRLRVDSAQDQITKAAVRESATNLVPADSVLMVTRSGILEHSFPVAINTVSVAINQDLKAWTPIGATDSVYIAYYLKANARNILDTCSKDGTTVSSIDFDSLAAYPVRVAPLGEQKRIVSKIDELFSRVEEGERALERVRKLVERYRQSVLKAAVTGELTREWRAKHKGKLESGEALLQRILKARRAAWEKCELDKMQAKGIKPANDGWKKKYQEPVAPDTSELPELPEGWVWASLEQLAWASSYGTSQKCSCEAKGTAVLRIPNVRNGRFDYEDIKNATADLGLELGEGLAPGDLLVVRTNGSESLIGVGAVLKTEPPFPCYFASYLIRFRLVLPEELSEWVNLCWQSHVARHFVDEHKATSAGQYNVSQSSLMELCLPVPPTLERQQLVDEVSQAISKSEKASELVFDQARLSGALRQGVLKSAFVGSLVTQDAADEPASILLARIAAERRASADAVTSKRKARPTKAREQR